MTTEPLNSYVVVGRKILVEDYEWGQVQTCREGVFTIDQEAKRRTSRQFAKEWSCPVHKFDYSACEDDWREEGEICLDCMFGGYRILREEDGTPLEKPLYVEYWD